MSVRRRTERSSSSAALRVPATGVWTGATTTPSSGPAGMPSSGTALTPSLERAPASTTIASLFNSS